MRVTPIQTKALESLAEIGGSIHFGFGAVSKSFKTASGSFMIARSYCEDLVKLGLLTVEHSTYRGREEATYKIARGLVG